MSQSNNSGDRRLSALEDEVETVKQLLVSTARYAESANQGVDRLAGQVERLTERVDEFVTYSQRLAIQQAERSQQLDSQFEQFMTIAQQSLTELRAGQERQDRILDYLLRHDEQR